jgi:leader peptidase (prepilin peptidase)/N-methyltransferase
VLIAVAVVAGLLIGSFLNVVVARVPAGESVATPSSRCPGCGAPIAARDNVPVLSWLALRGTSRCCGTPISRRYPLVEAFTALAFGLVTAWVWAHAGPTGSPASPGWPLPPSGRFAPDMVLALLAFLYLAAVSVVLGLIDIDTKRLPFWIVMPSWWVGAALLGGSALAAGAPQVAVRMLLGGSGLWLLYRLLHAIHPAGMGYGDVRLAALIGGYLAWVSWTALAVGAFLGFLLGALGGAAAMALLGARLKTAIPFGPYMLLGTWVALIAAEPIGRAYRSLVGL